MAVPGWPLPTFCTASMASTRTVSTAFSSSSVHSSFAGVVLTPIPSRNVSDAAPDGVPAQASPSLLTPGDTLRARPASRPLVPEEVRDIRRSSSPISLRVGPLSGDRSGPGARRPRRLRRAHQAARDRAAPAHHGAGDVLRRGRRARPRPGARHRRRRHAVGRLGVGPKLRLRPRHRRADAAHPSPRDPAPHRHAAGRSDLRGRARRSGDGDPLRLGQPAVGGAVAGGRVLLPLRLHDTAQASYDAEHRLGRPRGLLPGPDRLDRGDRRAGLDPRRALPGRLLLDAAAHLGTGAALPRGLRRRRRADAPGGGARRGGGPADRRLQLGDGRDLAAAVAGRRHRVGLSARGRRARRGLPRAGPPDVGACPGHRGPHRDQADGALPRVEPLPLAAVRGGRARPAAHPLSDTRRWRRALCARRETVVGIRGRAGRNGVQLATNHPYRASVGVRRLACPRGCRSTVVHVRGSTTLTSTHVAAVITSAAPSMCSITTTTGSPAKYCTKPTVAWSTSTAASASTGRTSRPVDRSRNQRPTVRPTSRKTRSAWSWLTWSGSSPLRGELASPAWGPEPVTTVPA